MGYIKFLIINKKEKKKCWDISPSRKDNQKRLREDEDDRKKKKSVMNGLRNDILHADRNQRELEKIERLKRKENEENFCRNKKEWFFK